MESGLTTHGKLEESYRSFEFGKAVNMTRVLRLRPHGEFDRVRQSGRSWSHPLLVIVAHTRAASSSSIDQARVSVAAGKKLGGAVVRNKVKRKLRVAIHQVYDHLPALTDLIVIARQPSLTASVADLTQALTATLHRAQLWQDRSQSTD